MAIVSVEPLPVRYRKIPARLRPGTPPIFPDDEEPTQADIDLARELFQALDGDSQDWYRRQTRLFDGL